MSSHATVYESLEAAAKLLKSPFRAGRPNGADIGYVTARLALTLRHEAESGHDPCELAKQTDRLFGALLWTAPLPEDTYTAASLLKANGERVARIRAYFGQPDEFAAGWQKAEEEHARYHSAAWEASVVFRYAFGTRGGSQPYDSPRVIDEVVVAFDARDAATEWVQQQGMRWLWRFQGDTDEPSKPPPALTHTTAKSSCSLSVRDNAAGSGFFSPYSDNKVFELAVARAGTRSGAPPRVVSCRGPTYRAIPGDPLSSLAADLPASRTPRYKRMCPSASGARWVDEKARIGPAVEGERGVRGTPYLTHARPDGTLAGLEVYGPSFFEPDKIEPAALATLEYLDLACELFPAPGRERYDIRPLLVPTLVTLSITSLFTEGGIPTEIGLLSNLRRLDAEDTEGDGSWATLPTEVGRLARLESLTTNGDYLPTEIGNLASLRSLDCLCGGPPASCADAGPRLPTQIGRLSRLETLRAWDINPEVGRLANLKTLEVGGRAAAPIPTEIGGLAQLVELKYGTRTGLPTELGLLGALVTLNVSRAEGPIPTHLGRLGNLVHLTLYGDRGGGLEGEIPPELLALPRLEPPTIAGGDVHGKIPPGSALERRLGEAGARKWDLAHV